MSIRLETLQIARLAPRQLGDATPRIAEFLAEQWTTDGGARDRAGTCDLYYTVFALAASSAVAAVVPTSHLRAYLESFADGDGLDVIHLSCLARCWASIGSPPDDAVRRGILARIEAHRAVDGGYAASSHAARGTAYHAFVALGAYQDLATPLPRHERLADSVASLACPDGSFSNDADVRAGNTPSTAAAVTVLHQLGREAPAATADWLLARHHRDGGFFALQGAPIPDLLSTGTALFALETLHASLDPIREPCLDFLDSLWTGRSFCGSWSDDVADSEYTWYALLALGHLAR